MAKASKAPVRASKVKAKASQAPATRGSQELVTRGSQELVTRGSPAPARVGRAMAWEARTPWASTGILTSWGSSETRMPWQRR